MKKIITLVLFCICLYCNAQQKITFSYDTAGNQVRRELCLIGCEPVASMARAVKEIETLVDEDLLKFSPEDVISYYPNPVKEELYLRWELTNNNNVRLIQVFNITGQLLRSYETVSGNNSQTIAFGNFPSGIYAILLHYSNGDSKSIKIIKL